MIPDSPAARAGFRPGDDVVVLDGQRLVSVADFAWALHQAPETARLAAVVRRAGGETTRTLDLPAGWRIRTDISKRVGTWSMRAMALGGLVLTELGAEESARRGLPADGMALLVKGMGQFNKHGAAKKAGFLKDDIIVRVGEFGARMGEGELIGRILQTTRPGGSLEVDAVARNAPQVEQTYFEVDRRSKLEALTRLIDLHDFRYGIIFCGTKVMVDDLDEHLHARGYAVDRLHGDIPQAGRDRVMRNFRERKFDFLIATDVAARGLDVDDLEVVFNFDLPNDAEDYTHRVGRTGRAGRQGRAFTFVSGQEIYKLQGLVRWAKLGIRRGRIPSLDEVEEARGNAFFERIRATLEARQFKPRDRMIDRLLDQGYASTDICSALIHLL
ncbi:MAG: helicase-related protein, partial [Opitutaceae bacterium]